MTAIVGLENGSQVSADFEIDTGCTGGLCIGKHFVQAHNLVATDGENERAV